MWHDLVIFRSAFCAHSSARRHCFAALLPPSVSGSSPLLPPTSPPLIAMRGVCLAAALACWQVAASSSSDSLHVNGGANEPLKPELPFPQALQGHDDHVTALMLDVAGQPSPELLRRYAVVGGMTPGIRRYNMFWNNFEPVPSQAAPFACPTGAALVPPSEAERVRLGYHRFHCINTRPVNALRVQLGLDNKTGAQGAGILYSAPEFYRHPNCTGFKFGSYVNKGGCVPLPEHMVDFEDFVRMLLAEYGLLLRHLVVWNEVASAAWMDCSPVIPNQWNPDGSNPLTPAQFTFWVSTYADMLRATDAATRSLNRTDSAMIFTSNDRIWDPPAPPAHPNPNDRLHVGGKEFNDLLWQLLENDTDLVWSMAVHPYDGGNPMDASDFDAYPRAFTFASLDGIDAYVVGQLEKRGLDPDSTKGRLFRRQYASEQGWPFPACCVDSVRARNICYAHAVSSDPASWLMGVTHNHFQYIGGDQGGQRYGLIPANISRDLSNGTGYPTFDAYVSTSPAQWEQGDAHFCCARWRMGCVTKQDHGTLDPLASNATHVVVHGWAWSEAAAKGGAAPVAVEVALDGRLTPGVPAANVTRANLVAAGAAPNPQHGFVTTVAIPAVAAAAAAGNDYDATHRVDAWGVAPNGTRFVLTSSPRCFHGTVECPCA